MFSDFIELLGKINDNLNFEKFSYKMISDFILDIYTSEKLTVEMLHLQYFLTFY
jgi:hypothetical protein